MSLALGATMDALATAMATATGVTNAYGWPVEGIVPPCAVVGYPEPFDLSMTFGRGPDRATFPVWVVVGIQQGKTTRDAASDLIAAVGDVKSTLEADRTLGGVIDSLRVVRVGIEAWELQGGLVHTAIRFDIDVIS